jgi:hypothetical protein
VRIRPEAEQKLRAGFQRRVDQQAGQYAAQLAHAEQLATQFECGEVAGVFTAEAGGGITTRAMMKALLPLALIPVLILLAATGFPGTLPLLASSPFVLSAWIMVNFWRGREPKRRIWFLAFTKGCMLLDGPQPGTWPLLWSQVTGVSEVWCDVYDPSSEQTRPRLTAYRVRWADGQVREIPRSLQNVRDPYRQVGQLLRGLSPALRQTMPVFPGIDEIIARYAARPGPQSGA